MNLNVYVSQLVVLVKNHSCKPYCSLNLPFSFQKPGRTFLLYQALQNFIMFCKALMELGRECHRGPGIIIKLSSAEHKAKEMVPQIHWWFQEKRYIAHTFIKKEFWSKSLFIEVKISVSKNPLPSWQNSYWLSSFVSISLLYTLEVLHLRYIVSSVIVY